MKRSLYILSVEGTLPPQVIRARVQDIQLHPVKKLLFIKFTEHQLRAEIVTRLQAGYIFMLSVSWDLISQIYHFVFPRPLAVEQHCSLLEGEMLTSS